MLEIKQEVDYLSELFGPSHNLANQINHTYGV